MKFRDLQAMNLRLFDGEGAGAAATGDGSAAGAAQAATPGSTRRGKSGDNYSNVLFGKQGDGAAATGTVTNAQEPSHAAGGGAGHLRHSGRAPQSLPRDGKRRVQGHLH